MHSRVTAVDHGRGDASKEEGEGAFLITCVKQRIERAAANADMCVSSTSHN